VLILALTVLGCSSPASSAITTVPDGSLRETPSVSAPTSTSEPTPTSAPTPTPDPAPELPPIQEIPFEDAIVAEPDADWVSLAAGVVWVAGVGDGIGRFDPETGGDRGPIRLPGTVICLAMDTGFDAVWAGDCNSQELLRVDARSGELTARIPLPAGLVEEGSVAVGDDEVWLLQRTGPMTLVGIDPASNSVASSIPAPTGSAAVRSGFGSLWVTDPAQGSVHRISPTSGEVLASIKVGRGPRFLAVGEGAVWTLDAWSGTVTRVDPGSDSAVATIRVSEIPVEGGDIAVGGGAVWARVSDSLVARIDPATNSVTERIGRPAGSGSVAADTAAVWISAHDIDRIYRVALR